MERIVIALPSQVETALTILSSAGFEAYVVGGCVRDSLLGIVPNDWDITTSAHPNDTVKAFADYRVVETGIKHGTVGVLIDGMLLEITTYRNDGEYLDNRHPINVTFSDRVEDDLLRRDFTVNAMAYHPERGLIDLFGGRSDLSARVIRCVGEPETRFREDGLRILRAVRFASVLEFSVEENTARAVKGCCSLLQNIAAERVREEFSKLICGMGAVTILRDYIDVIAQFLPELSRCVGFHQNTKYHCYDVFEHTLHALEMNEGHDLVTRIGILLHDIGKPLCYTEDALGGHFKGHARVGVEIVDEVLHRLQFDRATIERVKLLVELHDLPIASNTRAVKRLMRCLSDEDIMRLLEIKRCDRLAHAECFRQPLSEIVDVPRLMKEIRDADACLSLRSLAVKGEDIMALGVPKGKRVGEILNVLLEKVLDERLPNEKEPLLQAAREML